MVLIFKLLNKQQNFRPMGSVADPDPAGSEPFWSDPIHRPDPAIKSHKTSKKSNKLNIIFYICTYKI